MTDRPIPVSTMLELCRRPLKRLNPFDDSSTALEHIRFIDCFALENENSLQDLACQLLTATVSPHCLGGSTSSSVSSTEEVSKALKSHNQRPAKRQAKSQEGASDKPSDANIAMDPSIEQQPPATQTAQPPAIGVNHGLAGQPVDQHQHQLAWSYFGYGPQPAAHQGYPMPYGPYQTASGHPGFSSQSNPYPPPPMNPALPASQPNLGVATL